MGIRNKWSIAWGAAKSANEQGAQVIFTCGSKEKIEKIKELTDEIPNSDVFACDASSDISIQECFEEIKNKYVCFCNNCWCAIIPKFNCII